MAEQGFTLTSPEFASSEPIPATFTCDGKNISPELRWLHAPKGTRSFALIVDDPDAPGGLFTHWLLFNIPAETEMLAENEDQIGIAGRNDFQQVGYGGPCPPPNHGEHRYYFRLFALDVDALDLKAGATRADVEKALGGHILETATLMGRFERTTG